MRHHWRTSDDSPGSLSPVAYHSAADARCCIHPFSTSSSSLPPPPHSLQATCSPSPAAWSLASASSARRRPATSCSSASGWQRPSRSTTERRQARSPCRWGGGWGPLRSIQAQLILSRLLVHPTPEPIALHSRMPWCALWANLRALARWCGYLKAP